MTSKEVMLECIGTLFDIVAVHNNNSKKSKNETDGEFD